MKKFKNRFIILICILPALFYGCEKPESPTPPYQIYSSHLSQVGQGNPTENVLINELGISITWTRIDAGKFRGTLSKPINIDNSTLIIQLKEDNRIATGGFVNTTTIEFTSWQRTNLYQYTDGYKNAVIEIKSYPVKPPTN